MSCCAVWVYSQESNAPHPPGRGRSQLIAFQSIENSDFDANKRNALFRVDSLYSFKKILFVGIKWNFGY
jgi:hypothetical protein